MKKFTGYRSYRFEASHSDRIHNNDTIDQEKILGDAVKPHGHNYKMVLGISGAYDPCTKMIIELGALDAIVKETILNPYDHTYLDARFAVFNTPITNEWLAQKFQKKLLAHPIMCEYLTQLTLWDTDISCSTARRFSEVIYSTHIFDFTATHALHNQRLNNSDNYAIYGKCTREHGHNYKLKVIISGIPHPITNQLITKHMLIERIGETLEYYNYSKLHELPELKKKVATTEVLVEHLWGVIEKDIKWLATNEYSGKDIKLHGLIIQETDRNYFGYFGPKKKEMDTEEYPF